VKEITGTIGAILTAVFALAAILLAVFFRANRATSEMVQNEKGYAQLYSRLLAKEAEKKKAFEKIAIDFIAYGVTDNYFVALTELKYDKQQHSELTEKHNKLSQEWADIVKEHGEGISENLEEFDENELDGLIAKRKSTQSGIEADGSRLAGEEARLARELETFVPVSEIENKLDGLKSEKTRLQRRYAAAKGAIAALQEAKSNLATSYLPKMRETLQGYFSALTKSNNFKSVDIDETFKISVTEDGASRDMDYFSTGIKEVCVFCLRFALIDTMFKQESPFIMLDDPFVNFDDEKLQEVSVIVQKRAKTNQIVYFTCHKAFEDAVTAENE
jgi:uncharacterized protein YhaN